MQYFGLMMGLYLAGVVLFIPAVLVGGFTCGWLAHVLLGRHPRFDAPAGRH